MIKIEYLDNLTEEQFKADNVNYTLYQAYRESKANNLDTLNFNDVIWEYDIEPIFEFCRKYNIKQITVSSTFSRVTEVIYKLLQLGGNLAGMKEVQTGAYYKRTAPAYIIEF